MTEGSDGSARVRKNPFYLGLVSFFTDVHSEVLLALLPTFLASHLGLSKQFIGLIDGLADGAASSLKVLSGWLSDKLGRRKPLVVGGYALSWCSKTALAFATQGWHVLVLRFSDRVGKGVRTAPRDALLADSVESSTRGAAFGLHRMMDTAGAVVGSLAGFLMLGWLKGDYRATFLWASLAGVAALVALLALAQEVPGKAAPSRSLDVAETAARHRALFAFAGVTALFALGDFSYMFFVLRAIELGVPEHLGPLAYFASNVVYVFTPVPAGKLADRFGRKSLLVASYCWLALVAAGFALASGAFWGWVLMGLYGGQRGVYQTSARTLASELGVKQARGTPLGIFHAVQGFSVMGASVLAGWLWDRFGSGQVPFAVGALACLLAALAALFWLPGQRLER